MTYLEVGFVQCRVGAPLIHANHVTLFNLFIRGDKSGYLVRYSRFGTRFLSSVEIKCSKPLIFC